MRQLVHSLSGDDNLVPFHLWWRQTVLKSEKISKCFVQDCKCIFLYEYSFWVQCQLIWNHKNNRLQKLFWSYFEFAWNAKKVTIAIFYVLLLLIRKYFRNFRIGKSRLDIPLFDKCTDLGTSSHNETKLSLKQLRDKDVKRLMSSDIYIEKQMCIQVYQQLLSIKKSFFPFMFPDDLRAFVNIKLFRQR